MKISLISCFGRILRNRTIFLMGLLMYPLFSMAQVVPPMGETYCTNRELLVNFNGLRVDDPNKAKVGVNLTGGVQRQEFLLFNASGAPNGGNNRCRIYRVWASPTMQIIPGMTFTAPDGLVYDVYQSEVNGIGFAVGVGPIGTEIYTPIRGTGETLAMERTANNVTPSQAGVHVRVYMISTGQIPRGPTPGKTMTLLNLSGLGVGETLRTGVPTVAVSTGAIVNTAKTCMLQGNDDVVITLPTTDVARMNNISVGQTLAGDAESSTTRITFICDQGIRPSASLNDSQNTSGNESYLVNSTGPGFATGVSVRMTRGSNRAIIRMGPVSGGSHSFLLGAVATEDNTPYYLDLRARYVKQAANVTAGKVRARATINLEYK